MAEIEFEQKVRERPASPRLRACYARELFKNAQLAESLEQVEVGLSLPHACKDADVLNVLQTLKDLILGKHFDRLMGPLRPLVSPKRPPHFEGGRLSEIVLTLKLETLSVFAAVLRTSALDHVHLLSVIIEDIGDTGLRALRAAHLPKVRELSLWVQGHLSTGGVEDLARAPLMKRCEALYFKAERLSDSLIQPVLSSSPVLEELRLRSTVIKGVTPITALRIADGHYLSRLSTLELVGTSIGDEGALAIATSTRLAGLEELSLRDGILTNEGARILAATSMLEKLKSLDVSRNEIDEAGLEELRRLPFAVKMSDQHPDR